jgi:phospholipid/cholesterol/gamma-HCH transport system ATP-binding protein
MLLVEGVSRSFGTVPVLKDVTFSLEPGSLSGLIGAGGSGKSVLLKILGGIYRPHKGRVVLDGEVFDAHQAQPEPHESLSLMFQEGALFDSLTVYENVAFPLVSGKLPCAALPAEVRADVHDKVAGMLSRVGLSRACHKHPAQLSGGMRKRVSLARALVARPRYCLLDDPTAGLDPVASSVIMNLIVELHREYRPTMVMVSQDLRRLLPVVERIFALADGRIAFQGTLEELKASANEWLRSFVSCRFDLAA